MTAKHARAGKLTAKFYTDGWPDFTTVVCHILSPTTCDVSSVMKVMLKYCSGRSSWATCRSIQLRCL